MLLEGLPPATGRPPAKVGGLLLSAAARRFRLTEADLLSDRRYHLVSRARYALAYVLIETCGWSFSRIGRLLNKHHTTILLGHRRAKELYRTDQKFYDAVQELEEQL